MNRVVVKTQDGDVKISHHIYGHFLEKLLDWLPSQNDPDYRNKKVYQH